MSGNDFGERVDIFFNSQETPHDPHLLHFGVRG
jgi:hypothetical protein